MIRIILVLLSFGLAIQTHSKEFESFEELTEYIQEQIQGHHEIKGETNPESLIKQFNNCLKSIKITKNNLIVLNFVDKDNVIKNRHNIDIENTSKGYLCHGVISGDKVVKIGDKFKLFSDGHHLSTYLKLLNFNKRQVVFEYTENSFFGFMNYSSTETGILKWNLELK